MKLIEIKGLVDMDFGAPSPMVISNDTELFLTFYSGQNADSEEPEQRNSVYDIGISVLKFIGYIKYSFGIPGNETLTGHPYASLGLKSFSFYELIDSDLIENLRRIESVHPYFKSENWQQYKHFIVTFHDNMFECVAKGFDISEEKASGHEEAQLIIRKLTAKEF